MCRVTGFARKKPRREALDQADPVRNDETGLWQCPFCQKNDFPELSEVSDETYGTSTMQDDAELINIYRAMFSIRLTRSPLVLC